MLTEDVGCFKEITVIEARVGVTLSNRVCLLPDSGGETPKLNPDWV